MNVMISGSSGLIGSSLRARLQGDGHTVIRLSRSIGADTEFSGVDAVVHLAGEGIADGRWTKGKKRSIEESRVSGTHALATLMAKAEIKPTVFISASAIGYYGNRDNDVIDENSPIGTGFLSDVCKKWEGASRPAQEAGIRTVLIRTGIVLSTKGGALSKMLPPFRLGLGGMIGNGRQFMSWISLEDEINAILHVIGTKMISGPVNLVSPRPVTNREFTRVLGKILKRPAFFPLPSCAVRLLFGEMGTELLLSSTRVFPKKLVGSGFAFNDENLEQALTRILK